MARKGFDGSAEPSKEAQGDYPLYINCYSADGTTLMPGASVLITNVSSGSTLSATANALGQASVYLKDFSGGYTSGNTIKVSYIEDADYYISADDGSNWEEVTNGTRKELTNTGQILKFKVDGQSVISKLSVKYEV